MTVKIPSSELILNPDGSIYHLNLHPQDLADLVILVGDPERVPEVSKYFDSIDLKKQKREFVTHTGWLGKTRISAISTGIGTDNIDIVLNELDALRHINLETGDVISRKQDLCLVRIGTSGSLQLDVPINSMLVSTHGLGLDHLPWYYQIESEMDVSHLKEELGLDFLNPYLFESDANLLAKFDNRSLKGITATCCGFYAPQGRKLRVGIKSENLIQKLSAIRVQGIKVTNFEMETSAILALSKVFGFKAIAINAIVANRISHEFSADPHLVIDKTIQYTLDSLV